MLILVKGLGGDRGSDSTWGLITPAPVRFIVSLNPHKLARQLPPSPGSAHKEAEA